MDDVCRMLLARREDLLRQVSSIDIALRALRNAEPRTVPATPAEPDRDPDRYRTVAELARDAILDQGEPLRLTTLLKLVNRTREVTKPSLYAAMHKAHHSGLLRRFAHGLYGVPEMEMPIDPEVIDDADLPSVPVGHSHGNSQGNQVVERREAGGHLGEQHTEEIPLPTDIRRMVNSATPIHLLTVRRGR